MAYSHLLKFTPIGKEIAPTIAVDLIPFEEERG
jgi:hypothetical protein